MHWILDQGNCLEQTCHLRCRRVSGLCQASTPSGFSHFCCMCSLLELAITFLIDLTDAASSPLSFSCTDRAPCGSPMTPPELLGSLGAKPPLALRYGMMHRHQTSCLPIILHVTSHPSWNLPFTIVPLTITSHPTPTHHELRDISNPLNVVSHLPSMGDHRLSSRSSSHMYIYMDGRFQRPLVLVGVTGTKIYISSSSCYHRF